MDIQTIKRVTPRFIKRAYWKYFKDEHGLKDGKYVAEFDFWQGYFARIQTSDPKRFHRDYFEKYLLALAGQKDQVFLKDKVVADFGCGPLGSLTWATEARSRIGIDVLVDAYMKLGISEHENVVYVKSTENLVPLPTAYVDVLFTMNALDHVENLKTISRELLRILKPGGLFIGAFNLGEASTTCEPHTLTEKILDNYLLGKLNVSSKKIIPKHDLNRYLYSDEVPPKVRDGKPEVLVVTGIRS